MRAEHGEVAVIGGGIVGITTAVLLQSRGYPTAIYAQRVPFRGDQPPEFATVHAAASILPHSVRLSGTSHHTDISQQFFRALLDTDGSGVRVQRHYELFEDEPAPPDYLRALNAVEALHYGQVLSELGASPRHGMECSGWSFDCLFCEAPTYIRYLYGLFEAAGGKVTAAHLSVSDLLSMRHEMYFNCTGIGTSKLFNEAARVTDDPCDGSFEPLVDSEPSRIILGHYIRLRADPSYLTNANGMRMAYSYTPEPSTYRLNGVPADVYCYPRDGEWILGGSRIPLEPTDSTRLDVFSAEDDLMELPGRMSGRVKIPRPIFDLNAEILRQLTRGKVDLPRCLEQTPKRLQAGYGYRFERKGSSSIRLSCSRIKDRTGSNKFIMHNYGHGGAGYTLSWSTALEALRQAEHLGLLEDPIPSPSLDQAEVRATQEIRDLVMELI